MATDDDLPDDAPRADELRADELRADEPRADEPRAKDLLAQAMDPALLAELSSWFDRPSQVVAAEANALEQEDEEFREAKARRDRAFAAVDPALIDYVRRHETQPELVTPLPPLPTTIDERILLRLVRDQLERQSADEPAADERAYMVPRDIADAIEHHNAPQAVLRDLFRPVSEFQRTMESPFSEPAPTLDGLAEARAALAERREVPQLEPPLRALDDARMELRSILGRPWPDLVEEVKAARAAFEAFEAAEAEGR